MKKLSITIFLFLVILLNGDLMAQLQLTVPDQLPQEQNAFVTVSSDRLTLGERDLKSQLNLTIPESVIKTQSDYAARAKMMLALSLIMSLPTGDFGEGYNLGFGGNLTFSYMLYSYLILTGSIGYLSWGVDDEGFGDVDAGLSSIPFLVGARYLFATGSAFLPYVLAELGLHFMSFSYEYSFGGINYDQSETSTEFCLGLGGGFMYPLSALLLLDVNLRYWIISDAGNFALMAGLAYALGGM